MYLVLETKLMCFRTLSGLVLRTAPPPPTTRSHGGKGEGVREPRRSLDATRLLSSSPWLAVPSILKFTQMHLHLENLRLKDIHLLGLKR